MAIGLLSAEALAEIERGVRDESRIINGRIWTAPDGASADQQAAMGRTIGSIRGGKQVVAETVAKGLGQGTLASPRADWVPTAVGQRHDPGNVAMRESVQSSLSAAYGVPAAYLSSTATGPGLREAKRLAFLNKSLPLAKLMASELSEKLTPVSIQWEDLAAQGIDVHLRARAIQPLAELGGQQRRPAPIGGVAANRGSSRSSDQLSSPMRMRPWPASTTPPGYGPQGQAMS